MPDDDLGLDIRRQFGVRLRGLRTGRQLSQEELAHLAGLDRTYVSSVERGRRNISLENICRLAEALGVDAGRLVTGLRGPEGSAGARHLS